MIDGGDTPSGAVFLPKYPGEKYPVVCANVVESANGVPLRPAFVVREIGGAKLGVIGAVTRATPQLVIPDRVKGWRFDDEADSINAAALALKGQGVRAIVVVIHEGSESPLYEGKTRLDVEVGNPIASIIHRLDEEIDVVVTGHTHSFTNAMTTNRGNRPVLVTQALSRSMAFADIDLTLDARGDVAEKVARIVVTYADQAPGNQPDPAAAELVAAAHAKVAPRVDVVIAKTAQPLLAKGNQTGESALGDLIADAQRAAMHSDIAMTNPGGIRADLPAGDITWGEAYAVQPFGNDLVRVTLTGAELKAYLEQQFTGARRTINHVSGLSYAWDSKLPPGSRVVDVRVGGRPLNPKQHYTVTVNSYMANLGGPDAILVAAKERTVGPGDLTAFVDYLKSQPKPLLVPKTGRVRHVD